MSPPSPPSAEKAGLSERDWRAIADAWGKHATDEQRLRASRFLGALASEDSAAECAAAEHARMQKENLFEQSQLEATGDVAGAARARREVA
jgi:hypothetical protein